VFSNAITRRWVTRATAVAALSLASAGIPAAANAAALDCPAGSAQVCLYSNGQKVAAYRDQTSYWQVFNGAHRITSAANAFDPYWANSAHVAYFRHTNGVTSCIEPGRDASVLVSGYGDVDAIQIRPGGKCYPGTGI
jgi:hypothetical protein